MAIRALGIEQTGSNLHNIEKSMALWAISWKYDMFEDTFLAVLVSFQNKIFNFGLHTYLLYLMYCNRHLKLTSKDK